MRDQNVATCDEAELVKSEMLFRNILNSNIETILFSTKLLITKWLSIG